MFTIQTTTPDATTYRGTFDNLDLARNTAAMLAFADPDLKVDVVPVPDGVTPAEQAPIYC